MDTLVLHRNSAADLDRSKVRKLAFDRTSHFARLVAAGELRAVGNLRRRNYFSLTFEFLLVFWLVVYSRIG